MNDGNSSYGKFVEKILVFWKGAWSLTRGVSTEERLQISRQTVVVDISQRTFVANGRGDLVDLVINFPAIFHVCNLVPRVLSCLEKGGRENPGNPAVTFAVCRLTSLEKLSITSTSDGKREFALRDQVFPLIVVYC